MTSPMMCGDEHFYIVRLGNRPGLGAYLVTLEDEDGNEVISNQQSNAFRFEHKDFAELAAVALGDARTVKLVPAMHHQRTESQEK